MSMAISEKSMFGLSQQDESTDKREEEEADKYVKQIKNNDDFNLIFWAETSLILAWSFKLLKRQNPKLAQTLGEAI